MAKKEKSGSSKSRVQSQIKSEVGKAFEKGNQKSEAKVAGRAQSNFKKQMRSMIQRSNS